jgi:hypothetical protein
MREVAVAQAVVCQMCLSSRLSVANWLNKKALAVERLGPPFLIPHSGVPCREAAPLYPARGSGERCKLPQWGLGRSSNRQRFLGILNCIPTFLEVKF